MRDLLHLHKGTVPLERAFWTWAVMVGLLINLATTLGFLILATQDLLIAAAVVGYGVSLPYNLLVTIGVIRAAAKLETIPNPETPVGKARVYVAVTVLGALVLSFT
tara:strand:+ start:1353 stop:1670 length:318 start_codon:yes stop_codon:yes gene_type:complete